MLRRFRMVRDRAAKARNRGIADSAAAYRSAERDLIPHSKKHEEPMGKPKIDPAIRKARLDRDVQAALDAVSALSPRSKKKGKKHFPSTSLQKRMQSGDI